MAKRDFYEILGVNKGASASEMKSAYRKAAMRYHPDQNPGDQQAEAKFKELNEAYDVLKDDQKRAAYDKFGHAAFENGGPGHGGAGGFGGAGFGDIFDEMFGDFMGGGARRKSGPSRGRDKKFNMQVSFDDAFHGRKVDVQVPSLVRCKGCAGTGAADGAASVACDACGGAGKVRIQQGFFVLEQTCPKCHGKGAVIDRPCMTCSGSGVESEKKTLNVSIPAGIDDGNRIRLNGEGDTGQNNGPAGDLYIQISVAPHPLFERDGPNLHCQIPIAMVDAALGTELQVPNPDGTRLEVKIPEGSQTGQKLRLRGKGMPKLKAGGARGDMFVHLQVEVPVSLSERQRELLREFAKGGRGVKQKVAIRTYFSGDLYVVMGDRVNDGRTVRVYFNPLIP
ncbi:MAG: molecular chaperone DnaJ, partial [Pseudomonadota bacterium]